MAGEDKSKAEWTVPDEAVEAAQQAWNPDADLPSKRQARRVLEAAAPLIRADLVTEVERLRFALETAQRSAGNPDRLANTAPECCGAWAAALDKVKAESGSLLMQRDISIDQGVRDLNRMKAERNAARAEVERLRRRLRTEIGDPVQQPKEW